MILPALWPSQRSCRNRNRASVNADSARTLVIAGNKINEQNISNSHTLDL